MQTIGKLQQTIKQMEMDLKDVELCHMKATETTKKIKYCETVDNILTELQELTDGCTVDDYETHLVFEEIHNAQRALNSAIFNADELFKSRGKELRDDIEYAEEDFSDLIVSVS